MPELVQCRLRVGNAIKENDSILNELGKLIQHLSVQNGPVFDSHDVLKVLPSTIQALWQSIDASDPGPITLKKLAQVLETFATKVELDIEAFLSGGTTSTTFCSDFAWVMNLASISDPAELSARLRAHMLTPLHASLTVIEPEESLKAAQLCDCFLSSVCKMKNVCWYEKVESYLQNPVSHLRTDVDLTMVHEYVGDAEPWLVLDATALAQNACEWMAVDATGSHVKDANAFATQLRMLQLLEFDGKNSALRMAEIATAVFHRASSMILPPEGPQTNDCNNEPLIQEAHPESSTAWPSQFEIVDDDEDEFAECIECDKAPGNLKTTSIQQALGLVHWNRNKCELETGLIFVIDLCVLLFKASLLKYLDLDDWFPPGRGSSNWSEGKEIDEDSWWCTALCSRTAANRDVWLSETFSAKAMGWTGLGIPTLLGSLNRRKFAKTWIPHQSFLWQNPYQSSFIFLDGKRLVWVRLCVLM